MRAVKGLLGRGRRGTAALEFAVVAPVLITIMLCVADLGRAMDRSIRLHTAVRAGAQYALSFPQDTAIIGQRVAEALLGQDGVAPAQVSTACVCPAAAAAGVETADPGCTVPCTDRRRLLTISVSQNFTPLTFRSMKTLSARVTLRLE